MVLLKRVLSFVDWNVWIYVEFEKRWWGLIYWVVKRLDKFYILWFL